MARMPSAARHESEPSMFPLLAGLIALGVLLGLVVMPRVVPGGGPLIEKPAPDFVLPVVANGDAGAQMRLSDLRDKVVILDFWASWCGPCAMQAPILDRVAQRHDDVIVLGINVDDPASVAAQYAAKKGLSYPILLDADGEAQSLYQANTLPTVVIIDGAGNIRQLSRGLIRESAVEKVLANL